MNIPPGVPDMDPTLFGHNGDTAWPLDDSHSCSCQQCLEALEQPQQPEFKVPLPPMPMDVEQALPTTALPPMTTASLPPMALTLTPSTTTSSSMSLPTSITLPQPQLVISTGLFTVITK
uniref:Uncharacterized protein n=1 Tax=Romanomermis culicivorax TaxID=13658 RepID=A0A915L3H0_ROMCU